MKLELFQFFEGYDTEESELTVYNYTSGDHEYEYNDDVYVPAAMKRTEIESKAELSRSNIEITFNIAHSMARHWMLDQIFVPRTVTVFDVDTQESEVDVAWKGRLVNVKPSGSEIILTFENVFTSLKRAGLRARMLRSCRHSLYGKGCFVNKFDFQTAGIMSATDGLSVTVAAADALDDGWFNAGILQLNIDSSLHFITTHVGSVITLMKFSKPILKAFDDSDTGVTLFPGCDRTLATCDGKFDNLRRNGAFPWIPLRNPFNGSSIV